MPHELSVFRMTASGELVYHAIDTLEDQRHYSVSKQTQNWMEDVQGSGGSKVEGAGPQIQISPGMTLITYDDALICVAL